MRPATIIAAVCLAAATYAAVTLAVWALVRFAG